MLVRRFCGVSLEKSVFLAAGFSGVCVVALYLIWYSGFAEIGGFRAGTRGGWRETVSRPRWTLTTRGKVELTVNRLTTAVSISTESATLSKHYDKGEAKDTPSGSRGFLLVANYEQQLQAALRGFTQLASVARLLNLTSVEPFVVKTNLAGILSADNIKQGEALKLGDLYNMAEYRKHLKSGSNLCDLVSAEVFLKKASRRILLVFFLTELSQLGYLFHNRSRFVEINMMPRDYDRLYFTITNAMKKINWWVVSAHSQPFLPSHILLIDARPFHPLPLSVIVEQLNKLISKQTAEFGSATVIVDRWRGIHNVNNSRYFYYIPGFEVDSLSYLHSLPLSDTVLTAVEKFTKKLQSKLPVIGVHIRGERVLMDSQGNASVFGRCLDELREFLHPSGKVTNGQVYVFHDLQPYGTRSCSRYCGDGKKQFLTLVNNLGYPIVAFNPDEFDSVPNSPAFVSLVEMESLSRVNQLVMVGRGGFQQGVLERFLLWSSSNRTDKVHRICSTRPKRPWIQSSNNSIS